MSDVARLLRYSAPDTPTATIVADILRVFFPDACCCLDMTWGRGGFWRAHLSADLRVVGHDLSPAYARDGVMDFRALAYAAASFCVTVFDPPQTADAGSASIMGQRYGTYRSAELEDAVRRGAAEAWRVGRLGTVIKVCDSVHGQVYVEQSKWVREALEGQPPYDVVYQTRSTSLVDPKWNEQLSAGSNGAQYLVFRHGRQRHVSRRRIEDCAGAALSG